jgi:uncharacterized protein (DUF302 family)
VQVRDRHDKRRVAGAMAFLLSHLGQHEGRIVRLAASGSPELLLYSSAWWELQARSRSGDELASSEAKDEAAMGSEEGGVSYTMREPYPAAIEAVRRSLANRGLRVVGQLDLASRVERSLGIVVEPCSILFVLPLPEVLHIASLHPGVASLLPLHIVVSANGGETRIQAPNRVYPDTAMAAPISEIQSHIADAIGATPGITLQRYRHDNVKPAVIENLLPGNACRESAGRICITDNRRPAGHPRHSRPWDSNSVARSVDAERPLHLGEKGIAAAQGENGMPAAAGRRHAIETACEVPEQ